MCSSFIKAVESVFVEDVVVVGYIMCSREL